MGGISSQYTSFEKVQISTGYSTARADGEGWNITLTLKNSGSGGATITHMFVNDAPTTLVDGGQDTVDTSAPEEVQCDMDDDGLTLESGESGTIMVYIPDTYSTSGTTLNIKLHSAGGMDYIKLVKLVKLT